MYFCHASTGYISEFRGIRFHQSFRVTQRRARRLDKTDTVDADATAQALLDEPTLGPVRALAANDPLVAKIEAVLERRERITRVLTSPPGTAPPRRLRDVRTDATGGPVIVQLDRHQIEPVPPVHGRPAGLRGVDHRRRRSTRPRPRSRGSRHRGTAVCGSASAPAGSRGVIISSSVRCEHSSRWRAFHRARVPPSFHALLVACIRPSDSSIVSPSTGDDMHVTNQPCRRRGTRPGQRRPRLLASAGSGQRTTCTGSPGRTGPSRRPGRPARHRPRPVAGQLRPSGPLRAARTAPHGAPGGRDHPILRCRLRHRTAHDNDRQYQEPPPNRAPRARRWARRGTRKRKRGQ